MMYVPKTCMYVYIYYWNETEPDVFHYHLYL